MTPLATTLATTIAMVAAAPAPPAEIVLNCYVVQSSALGLGQFARHLRIDPESGRVSIADALRGGGTSYVGDAALVELTAARIVFDYRSTLSSGRTWIDRGSGRFVYSDGRSTVTGSCQPGGA